MSNDKITAAAREPYDAMGPIDTPNPPAARATLADVQPGGRVRLGDKLPPLPKMQRFTNLYGETCAYSAEQMRDYARAALSAQPSPGGQNVLFIEELAELRQLVPSVNQKQALDAAIAALAARQPVGEPVDDYDSAFQEANRPPYLVDAAGIYALQSFLTVAEEFRRSAEPYIEAINEGACGGEDEVSEAFDTQLARAKEAVSRSVVYTAPPAQAVDLAEFKALYRAYVRLLESGRDRIRDLGGTCDPVDVMEANDVDLQAARRVLDSQAARK